MTRFYKGIRVDPFEHMPFTVLVTINGSEPSKWPGWNTFVSAFRFCAGITGCRNLWLLKPTRSVLSRLVGRLGVGASVTTMRLHWGAVGPATGLLP
jgi:hypothetical protein